MEVLRSMALTYYGYNKCGTCRKAKKWLEDKGIEFKEIDITQNPPTAAELEKIIKASNLELKKFFNVSGMKYRELNLKDKLPAMTDEEKIKLLSSDGMLLKRPLLTDGEKVTVGFKEEQFEEVWGK